MTHKTEAASIVAIAAGKVHAENQRSMRLEAAKQLLDSIFDELSTPAFKEAGITVERPNLERAWISILFTSKFSVGITYREHDGAFSFLLQEIDHQGARLKEIGTPLTMAFDPVAKVFLTGEPDTWITPPPGEPIPQRNPGSKLLVVALEACNFIGDGKGWLSAMMK